MMNKTKLKVIAGILVVFLLGTIIGALGTGVFVMRKMRQFAKEGPALQKAWFMKRLTRRLDLTEAQQPEVANILDQTEEEINEFMQKSFSEFAEIMQRRNAQLKEILTPEQQKKLDEMSERFHKNWQAGPFHKTQEEK
jgi:Spy/CpxP family protein refolding chaperone